MEIVRPSADELAELLAHHAHRYPERSGVTMRGDGEDVRLPLLLGNPSGACSMPSGSKPSPAWASLLSGGGGVDAALARQLADDCVLYPPRATWAQWVARWPGLPGSVASVVIADKLAMRPETIAAPVYSDEAPAPIAAALAAHPRAAWRWLRPRPRGDSFAVAINPPESAAYRMYTDALRKPGSDAWAMHRQLVDAVIVACVRVRPDDSASTEPVGATLDRFPGLVLGLVGVAKEMVGASVEITLGEW